MAKLYQARRAVYIAGEIDPSNLLHYNSEKFTGPKGMQEMTITHSDMLYDEILKVLTQQAIAQWGKERAQAMTSSLEQAARQLADVSRSLPGKEVEPGFYQ